MLKTKPEVGETSSDSVLMSIASMDVFILHSVLRSTGHMLDYSSNSKAQQENIYTSSWDFRSRIWYNVGYMKGNKATMESTTVSHTCTPTHVFPILRPIYIIHSY
jgi:hypothetical protein